MSKHPFRGMGVALVTPFTESQEVDYKSLERLLEHLLRDGATDFIVIHGTTGESPCLTRGERQRVTGARSVSELLTMSSSRSQDAAR